MCIDGLRNNVIEADNETETAGPHNPHNNAFFSKETPLTSELKGTCVLLLVLNQSVSGNSCCVIYLQASTTTCNSAAIALLVNTLNISHASGNTIVCFLIHAVMLFT
jgi:hypothetical protein